MNELLAAKSDQAIDILKKLDIDLWMITARESSAAPDPALSLVVGGDVVWTSFFMFSKNGDKIALVGNFDVPMFEQLGHFTEVNGYTRGVKEDLIKTLTKLNPRKIAINFSLEDPIADGLPHGLYLHLIQMLKGTSYGNMFVSAEALLDELRAVKLPQEIDRIKQACKITNGLFTSLTKKVRADVSGLEIYDFLKKKVKAKGLELSFPPSISIGTKSSLGHSMITNDRLDKGELFHIDFGVVYEGYCSDMQRLIYLLRDGESEPPDEVIQAFETVSGIILKTAKKAKPGVTGYSLDQIARDILNENGYPEYQHALGHQVGRFVHDGGTILAPRWERYGQSPYGKLLEGNVFTLELEVVLEGIGPVSLEEDILVTSKGGKFLSRPQRRLVCV